MTSFLNNSMNIADVRYYLSAGSQRANSGTKAVPLAVAR